MNLSKTILITGCSSGIGYSAAIEFKKEAIMLLPRQEKSEDVSRLIQEGFTAIQLDLG